MAVRKLHIFSAGRGVGDDRCLQGPTTSSMTAATITIRLLISVSVVMLVGVSFVVTWPLILIGVVIVAVSKAADACKRARITPPVAAESGRLVSRFGDEAAALHYAVTPG